MAAVIALIGYLHDHTVAAIFLVGVAVIGAFLVYVDVARERAWWPFSKRRHPTTPGALVTTKEARELLAAPEQASSDQSLEAQRSYLTDIDDILQKLDRLRSEVLPSSPDQAEWHATARSLRLALFKASHPLPNCDELSKGNRRVDEKWLLDQGRLEVEEALRGLHG